MRLLMQLLLAVRRKLDRVHAHVNVSASISALLFLVLFLPEIAALGGGEVAVGPLAIGAGCARLCRERVVFEPVVDKLCLRGVDAGEGSFGDGCCRWFGGVQ